MKIKEIIKNTIVVTIFILGSCTMVEAQIKQGKGLFEFTAYEHLDGKKMSVYYYLPVGDVSNMPVLFVMHGVLRNADVYRDNWVDLANKYKVLVIVPEFSQENFPRVRSYNYGNVLSKNGFSVDEKYWSYSLIDPIFDYVVKLTGSKSTQYDLFGHSAGSQFAHRFFMFKKNSKANRIVASNAGSYMALNNTVEFPFGLKGTGIGKDRLKKVFSKKLVVQLGEEDNDPNARHLPKDKEAMKQGAHRFERGHYFYKTAKKVAQAEGLDFNWEIRTVSEVAHNNAGMAIDAAAYLYGK